MENCCKENVVNIMAHEANEIFKILEIMKEKNYVVEVKSETVETEDGNVCGFYINVFDTEKKELIGEKPILTYTINSAIQEWYNHNISDIDPEILEEIPPEIFTIDKIIDMQNESDRLGVPYNEVLYHTYLDIKQSE